MDSQQPSSDEFRNDKWNLQPGRRERNDFGSGTFRLSQREVLTDQTRIFVMARWYRMVRISMRLLGRVL